MAEAFDPAWCDSCHLADGHSVGCTSCHLGSDGAVRVVVATPRGEAAHRERVDPTLGTEGCASCHQIAVPSHQPGAPRGGVALQTTYDEWQATGTDRPCIDCHMGDAGHRMPGVHDRAFREAALRVTVAPEGASRWAVTLHASGVGHAAPTGDAFHHVEVRLGAGETCEQARVVRFVRAVMPDGRSMVEVADTRVPPGAESRTLRVGAPGEATHWCARYVFADPAHHDQLPAGEVSVPLGGGALRR